LLLVTLLACSLDAQTWTCSWKDSSGGGWNYNFVSINSNTSDPNGLWQAPDTNLVNNYFWKMCDPTTNTPSSGTLGTCATLTQVCQQPGTPPDKGCGLGPPIYSFVSNGGGVVMKTSGGTTGCSPVVARSTTLNVLCARNFGKSGNSVDKVIENPGCVYTINFYSDSGCGSLAPVPTSKPTPLRTPIPTSVPTPTVPTPTPTPTPFIPKKKGLSGGSVFLIIFFCGFFVYFAAGIGWNAYHGATGVEMIPNVEFWKDLPFLVKDGFMFVFNFFRSLC